MTLVSLDSDIGSATSLLDLACRLGRICLENESLLLKLLGQRELLPQRLYLEQLVAEIDPADWTPEFPGGLAHLVHHHKLDTPITHLSMHHPLEYLAFLRGICRRPLNVFFEKIEDRVTLEYGMPVQAASRPINLSMPSTTPSPAKISNRELLGSLGYTFFRQPATDSIRIVMDFSQRDRLDDLTWAARKQLPRIATMHPFLGSGYLDFTSSGDSFFDVKPKEPKITAILKWLRSVSDHEIAVLPELCLPAPDALANEIAASPSEFPALIVAGSAHVRHAGSTGITCANESHLYLDGKLVSIHRKIHPLRTERLGNRKFDRELSEGITSEPKEIIVLRGEHTGLAVAICADLNEAPIPALLEDAWVNLLLVPALTYSAGGFNGTVCGLASRRQGVCVIVNANLEMVTDRDHVSRRPFLILAGVPRPEPSEQSATYRDPLDPAVPQGYFNPNLQLRSAVQWR